MLPASRSAPDSRSVIAELRSSDKEPWILRPREHAKWLPGNAAALKDALLSAPVAKLASSFEEQDDLANDAQRRYFQLRKSTIWMTFGTVAAAAILAIFPPSLFFAPIVEFYVILGFLGVLCTFFVVALGWGKLKPQQHWQQAWHGHRAQAELLRREYFETILFSTEALETMPRTSDHEVAAQLPALPLKFEYFAAYQIDVQIAYYRKRSGDLAKEAGRYQSSRKFVSRFGSVAGESLVLPALGAVLLVAIGYSPVAEQGPTSLPLMSTLSRFSHEFTETNIAKALLLALILAASGSTALFAHLLVNNAERNARRYFNSLRNLELLASRGLAPARAAATRGEVVPVMAFVRSIHDLMAAEHQSWLVLTEPDADLRLAGTSPSPERTG